MQAKHLHKTHTDKTIYSGCHICRFIYTHYWCE